MKDNIPGFMGYHVSKTGNVYSRYVRGSRGKLSNDFTPLRPKKRPKYHSVSLYRDGKSTKKIAIVKDRWTDGLSLEISHNGYQTTSIGNLDLEDLKKLRKVVRKAIREHENN